jgi:class 3 adenylate cyclase
LESLVGEHISCLSQFILHESPIPKPHVNINQSECFEKNLTYQKTGSSEIHLKTQLLIALNSPILIMRDITQTMMYQKLVNEEKQKSDNLLSFILPSSLVPRVQSGETNISFAVQSATVLFLDIVEFTPWCGSLPASKIMSTLNKLYSDFDRNILKYPTLTKIKCIGDCYMAAGGIFGEINQPAIHAKEMVSFGLDCINIIEKVNKLLDTSLRIRIGIDTGGPIVAGVIGTKKPIFEILGPVIVSAGQMEHHGVSMKVQISRPVYELIYGGQFNVKERGEVTTKFGKTLAYLVEPNIDTIIFPIVIHALN